ncbi:MAG: carbohydrate ABC transporter permease [Spirochaetaceae bacterium]|nr:carbohydrate ABC transporter permease [Spirochaetaceae bacterium]
MRRRIGERFGQVVIVLVMAVFAFSVLLPFARHVSLSVSTPLAVLTGGLYLLPQPGEMTLKTWERVFRQRQTVQAYYWSLYRTVVGTVMTVFVTAMMAYPLSKRYLPFRRSYTVFVLIAMFTSGGIVPQFLIVRGLGMYNTMWPLWLLQLVPLFWMIITRNFFMTLPEELTESARIDGAGELYVFLRLIIPLSKPVIATLALITVVFHWNSWFDILIYVSQGKTFVTTLLRRIIADVEQEARGGIGAEIRLAQMLQDDPDKKYTAETVRSATLLYSLIPILLVYPFLQKYFAKGLLIGSLKG